MADYSKLVARYPTPSLSDLARDADKLHATRTGKRTAYVQAAIDAATAYLRNEVEAGEARQMAWDGTQATYIAQIDDLIAERDALLARLAALTQVPTPTPDPVAFDLPNTDETDWSNAFNRMARTTRKLPNGYEFAYAVPVEDQDKRLWICPLSFSLAEYQGGPEFSGQEVAQVYSGPDATVVAWVETPDGTELYFGFGSGTQDPKHMRLQVANSYDVGYDISTQHAKRTNRWPASFKLQIRCGPPGTDPRTLLPDYLKTPSLAPSDNRAVLMGMNWRQTPDEAHYYVPADQVVRELLDDPNRPPTAGVVLWTVSRPYDDPRDPFGNYDYSGSPMLTIPAEPETFEEVKRAAAIAKTANIRLGVTVRYWAEGPMNPARLDPATYFRLQANWCIANGITLWYVDSTGGQAASDFEYAASLGILIIPECEGRKGSAFMRYARPLVGHKDGVWLNYEIGTHLHSVTPMAFVDGDGMTTALAKSIPADYGAVVGGGWGWALKGRQ